MNENKFNNYSIDQVSEKNYDAIDFLYKEVFNHQSQKNEISNKYNTSYTGIKNTGFLAFENNFPAAYYGVFPTEMLMSEKTILTAQSGDTMTHAKHQKKGLFIHLAKTSYQFAKENGVKFIFGFPNENSYPGFEKKLNWKFYGKMMEFRIKGSSIPLCELAKKYPVLKSWYNNYCSKKLKKYIIPCTENLLKELQHEYGIKKSIDYYNYKKKENIFLVNINGFTLFIKPDNHLLIGDVLPFNKARILEFITTVKKLSLQLKCKTSIITISKNHWLYTLLSEHITPTESLPIGFLTLDENDIFPYEKMCFSLIDYDTY